MVPARSELGFLTRMLGLIPVRGRYSGYDGELHIDNAGNASGVLRIDAATISTGINKRDAHLRSTDFFAVEDHPRGLRSRPPRLRPRLQTGSQRPCPGRANARTDWLRAGAMAWLAHLTPSASYGAHVLPALLVLGVGMGATGAPAMFTATYNVPPADNGVASAMVSTMQQVGGAVGASGLSTIFASAVSSYGHTHTPIPGQGVPASVASRGAVGGDLACTDSLTSRVRPVLGVPRKLARPER